MKSTFLIFVALTTISTASYAAGEKCGSLFAGKKIFAKKELDGKSLLEMEGKSVVITDQNGKRKVGGLVIAAHKSAPPAMPMIYIRMLEKTTNEILLQEYILSDKDLKQIEVFDQPKEIQQAELLKSKEYSRMRVMPYSSNVESYMYLLDASKPVRIVLANLAQNRLEILEGKLALPTQWEVLDSRISQKPLMLKLETKNGVVEFNQLHIVHLYGTALQQNK